MLELCKIDGISFSDLVTALEEKYEVIEGPNSGQAIYRNREIRDITGIKISHTITFSPGDNPERFDELKNYLFNSIRPFVVLETVTDQKQIIYEAAYNTGNRRVAYLDSVSDVLGWDDLTVEFRPMENQIDIND